MRGDFSRLTFKRTNHYNNVYWQQGRPVTDADQNEAQDIATYRTETEATDVIGPSGAPKENPGFGLSINSAGELVIGQGRYYVDGILCENDQPITYGAQPHWPNPSAFSLEGMSVGLVYLDVFKRYLTFQDDESIREVALNEVDTTTRLQTVWQVKLLPLDLSVPGAALATLTGLAAQIEQLTDQIAAATDPVTLDNLIRQRNNTRRQLIRVGEQLNVRCDGTYGEWDALIAPPTGALEVSTIPGGTATDPCDVPPGGGYTRGENQFYRVEVQAVPTGGGRNGATFKWSRDNGSIVARIEAVGSNTTGSHSGTIFDVDSVGRDDYLSIHTDDWVEYTDDSHELDGVSGVLVQVKNADITLNRIELQTGLTVNLDLHPKLRKWDQTGTGVGDTGVAMNTTDAPVPLESGLQVEFTDGVYHPGDYWQFAARAITGQHDFPPGAQPRFGVVHHYARLGLVAFDPTTDDASRLYLLLDCRDLFPPLTAITAADVSYDDTLCHLGDVRTVQEAIEVLCQREGGGGTCTFSVAPGPAWQEVFAQIPDGGNAEICFTIGDYELAEPVVIANKGHLKLTGAGFGTRILARKAETVLTFQNCADVIVRDLAMVAGAAGSGENETSGLLGALTFENCGSVSLDTISLQCEPDVIRSAACLRMINDNKLADLRTLRGLIDVRNCRFFVGHNQIGALVVNGARVHFEDNLFQCQTERRGTLRFPGGLRENLRLRAEVRRVIWGGVRELKRGEDNPADNEQIFRLGDRSYAVTLIDSRLRQLKFFDQLVEIFSPERVRDERTAEEYFQDAIDNVLLKPTIIPNFAPYFELLVTADLPALYQGIVIGGEEAEEVRVLNNTIINALQGIHLGQSRRNQPSGERLKSTVVHIQGNTVYSRITATANREAYGIYIGNCDSLHIERNNLLRQQIAATEHMLISGVFVQGILGKRMIIRHNETEAYSSGVFVDPVPLYDRPLWMVVDNIASVVTTDARIQVANNRP